MARFLLWAFALIGCCAALVVLFVVSFIAIQRYKEANPTQESLAYILDWGDLREHSRIEQVLQSCVTPRNPIVGDQTKAYHLQIAPVPSEVWESESIQEIWFRGPFDELLVKDALETATMFARSAGCREFPILDSYRYIVSFPEITAYHKRIEGVRITAYDTETGSLYHADVHW